MAKYRDKEDLAQDLPQQLDTQDDILRGYHTLVVGLLEGGISSHHATEVRRVLESASKTIAMRDTVKNNAKPGAGNGNQINTTVVNVMAPPPKRGQIAADPLMAALGALRGAPPEPLELPDAQIVDEEPAPERQSNTARVEEGRAESREGRSALLASLRGRTT